ncbi:polyprenyl synthetase family protein [Thermoactinospora rubra]|uniref:polyprenyl synthetase family protein n=1 Tax=Thermoactinospora rubra TaxID=1088767 RepID=UPI001301C113|nr:polyprenyl synthetase family protein [Thermoactinospora rubra]
MQTVTAPAVRLREMVDRRLEALLAQGLGELGFLGADAAVVRDHLARFALDGGKRLRPMFVYWGHRAAGGDGRQEAVLAAGCAVELIHVAALLLDDVMDQTGARRGRQSAHAGLAALHRRSGWRGDPARFGESAASLLALLAFTWADAALAETGRDLGEALDVLTRLRVEVIGGQYLDLACSARGTADATQVRAIAVYKTAKYTVERPLHLGHAIAGGSPLTRRLLTAYALPVGEAFQLRDDILGVFGDPAVTGKPVGEDLRQGKQTLLLDEARRRAPARGAAVLADVRDERDVAAARELIASCGALEAVERRIGELVDRAAAVLDSGEWLPPDARAALVELAELATARSA